MSLVDSDCMGSHMEKTPVLTKQGGLAQRLRNIPVDGPWQSQVNTVLPCRVGITAKTYCTYGYSQAVVTGIVLQQKLSGHRSDIRSVSRASPGPGICNFKQILFGNFNK